jgi:cell division protein FtsI/penicillin-binding protein 2
MWEVRTVNKQLHQLFIAVVVLFTIIGISSSLIMTVFSNQLNADPRNIRALYHEYSIPRGAILASNGKILAESTESSDSYKYQRKYVDGPVFAPVTGYYSIVNRADRGIEASENSLLSGQNDSLWLDRLISSIQGKPNSGASVETSINYDLQEKAYQLLGSSVGAVVAIEPSTGRILVMASTPSYDPNKLASHNTKAASQAFTDLVKQNPSPMLNNTTSQLYPPGSTFKLVVAAAALESGKYTPDTQLSSPPTWTLPGTTTQLPNTESWRYTANGKKSMADCIAYSSNTCFAQLGIKLGDTAISEQAEKLGYDNSIAIDGSSSEGLPMNAVASKFPIGQSPDKLALASIGQGDTVATPLQNALIAATIANGGKYMKPTLVDTVRAPDLSVISQTTPEMIDQAFSQKTAQSLTSMMESVVTKADPQLSIPNIKIAAKTGTAQTGDNSTSDGWIVGFAPADKPKIAIAVVIHNANTYGVDTAGPVMKQLMQEALKPGVLQ